MPHPQNFTPASRVLITAAATIIVIAGLRSASSIVAPLLMAIFVAIISTPPLFWLQRHGASPGLALIIVIGIIVAIGFATAAAVGSALNEFQLALPGYEASLKTKLAGLANWLAGFGIDLSVDGLSQYINPSSAIGVVGKLVNGLTGLITNTFLITLGAAFILIEASGLPSKMAAVIKNPKDTLERLSGFIGNVQQYLVIKTVVSFITGVIVTIWLWVMGVDFPVLWGWLAFFLNFVPYIGSIIAALPPVVLALVQPELGLNSVIWVVACYVGVNVVVGNVIEPKFFGQGLGLSTFVVFISLVFWGWVLGAVGMLLSIPLTMLVKIGLEGDPRTQWLAVLLSAHAPEENSQH